MEEVEAWIVTHLTFGAPSSNGLYPNKQRESEPNLFWDTNNRVWPRKERIRAEPLGSRRRTTCWSWLDVPPGNSSSTCPPIWGSHLSPWGCSCRLWPPSMSPPAPPRGRTSPPPPTARTPPGTAAGSPSPPASSSSPPPRCASTCSRMPSSRISPAEAAVGSLGRRRTAPLSVVQDLFSC